MISIAKDLRPILLSKENLTAKVGDNIFPLYAPEDTTGDFILYQRTKGGTYVNQMGVSAEWCEVTFNIVSGGYGEGIDIAEELRKALQDVYVDGDQLLMSDTREEIVGEGNVVKYVQILVFTVGKPEE